MRGESAGREPPSRGYWAHPRGNDPDAQPSYVGLSAYEGCSLQAVTYSYAITRKWDRCVEDVKNSWDEIEGLGKDHPTEVPVLAQVLQSLDTAAAVIVERGYFDLDCRSEESVAIVRQHRFVTISHDRLHFFDREIDLAIFVEALYSAEAQQQLQHSYLGYVVLRNSGPDALVGRTMIAPPRTNIYSGLALKYPRGLAWHVRTRVREHLTLAGIPLYVDASPFMQQDGYITRCAHAAAWMVHYAAVLRGLIPRKSIASIRPSHEGGGDHSLIVLPNPGLTVEELTATLLAVGLSQKYEL